MFECVYICILLLKLDLVAQLVEHLPFKERVLGSSPSPVTKEIVYTLKAHVAELVDAPA